jgi:hypothetical protein
MTYSPVVAPRQVELLVSPLSGTIGAPIDTRSLPDDHDAEGATPGPVARQASGTGAVAGQ